MADEEESELNEKQKIDIAKWFLLNSPPGEIQFVAEDVKAVLNDDVLYEEALSEAFPLYNKSQMISLEMPGGIGDVLVTSYGELSGTEYLDPRTAHVAVVDHIKQVCTDVRPTLDEELPSAYVEEFRCALDGEILRYVGEAYPKGVCSVYCGNGKDVEGPGSDFELVVVISAVRYSPQNFCNGSWRSVWSIEFKDEVQVLEFKGKLQVGAHYFEEGNVQLDANHECKDSTIFQSSEDSAITIGNIIRQHEADYLASLEASYSNLPDTTFKDLRRKLPVTRTLFPWHSTLQFSLTRDITKELSIGKTVADFLLVEDVGEFVNSKSYVDMLQEAFLPTFALTREAESLFYGLDKALGICLLLKCILSDDKTEIECWLTRLMILVDDAGGEWPMIGHAPWNGCNLAGFVMPFFLFIVGMSIALSLKRIPDQLLAVKKVILRTLKLLFWGLLLQGGFSHAPDKLTYGVDMKEIRWCGILQMWHPAGFPFSSYTIGSGWLQHVYSLLTLLLYMGHMGDWKFTVHDRDSSDYGKSFTVFCGTRGKLDPPCNAVGYIDRQVLGINHMYQHPAWKRSKACTENSPYEGPFRNDTPSWCRAPFEPEGIVSSISAILSTIIGVHFGHVLIHMKGHQARLKHWILMGFAFLILGNVLHFTHAIPSNKQLYTFSYVCITSGAAALVFSAFYSMVDIYNIKFMFLPLEWIGMNAMLVYVMAAEGIFAGFFNGWYYKDPHNTLIYWIQKHIFVGIWHSRRVGILLYVLFAEILFWGIVAGILHWLGIYWKL
ncbi:hypothetical protein ACLB2K_064965 [Fragaria x ananassa]